MKQHFKMIIVTLMFLLSPVVVFAYSVDLISVYRYSEIYSWNGDPEVEPSRISDYNNDLEDLYYRNTMISANNDATAHIDTEIDTKNRLFLDLNLEAWVDPESEGFKNNYSVSSFQLRFDLYEDSLVTLELDYPDYSGLYFEDIYAEGEYSAELRPGKYVFFIEARADSNGQQFVGYANRMEILDASATPVPAPGAFWLLGGGLVGFLGWRKRFID